MTTELTAEQIQIALPPGPARNEALARVRQHEATKHARAFRDLVLAGSYKEAGEMFLETPSDLTRKTFCLELEGDECGLFARHSNREVVAALLMTHPTPAFVRRELVPDEAVPMWCWVRSALYQNTDDSAYHRAQLDTRADLSSVIVAKLAPDAYRRPQLGFFNSSSRELTRGEVETLYAAGAGYLIGKSRGVSMGYTRDGQPTDPDPRQYRGLSIEGTEMWPMDKLAAVRSVDPELDAAITSGAVVVQQMTIAESRARMAVAGGQSAR